MLARDVMTTDVATVRPDTPVETVARILLTHRISGVPVVDADGAPVGVVSEWDLVGQHSADRVARRDEWLARLAQGLPLAADFLEAVEPASRTAGELAHRAPITVADDTDLAEVAQLVIDRRIGRVFVTREGRLVGVVSRRDLVRAHIPGDETDRPAEPVDRTVPPTRADLAPPPVPAAPSAAPDGAEPGLSAGAFRRLVERADADQRVHRLAVERAREEERRRRISELAAASLDEASWRDLLDRARTAAAQGERELLLLRFPSDLCTDRGRAINAPDPQWPTTLRGIAAEIFLRWERELKPVGFGLTAQILDFPGGFPGDAGLTLRWGG
ncbi:MAG: CBS domain-containing protein [Siculibacillus sp.]|nr:CBS domain-containing protein [Siculibacillus sp.]